MDENIKELWGAHIYFPKENEEIKFSYSSMEIVRHYPGVVEMCYSYFTDRNNSTHYFEKSMLDREYEITDELTVFYSASKEKCVEWLQNKRASLLQSYKTNYERLENSEIKEVEEGV